MGSEAGSGGRDDLQGFDPVNSQSPAERQQAETRDGFGGGSDGTQAVGGGGASTTGSRSPNNPSLMDALKGSMNTGLVPTAKSPGIFANIPGLGWAIRLSTALTNAGYRTGPPPDEPATGSGGGEARTSARAVAQQTGSGGTAAAGQQFESSVGGRASLGLGGGTSRSRNLFRTG